MSRARVIVAGLGAMGSAAAFALARRGALLGSSVCPYTNAPDGHFVLGPHPAEPRVWIVSPCSGHGCKFAPVVGEMVAEAVLSGAADRLPPLFAPARLGS